MVESALEKLSQIHIELRDNECSLFAGQYIHGKVHICERLVCPAESLTVTLHGFEEITTRRKHRNVNASGLVKFYELDTQQIRTICRIEFYIAQFEDCLTRVGNFVYPFKMQAPTWLPESLDLQSEHNSLKIRY